MKENISEFKAFDDYKNVKSVVITDTIYDEGTNVFCNIIDETSEYCNPNGPGPIIQPVDESGGGPDVEPEPD